MIVANAKQQNLKMSLVLPQLLSCGHSLSRQDGLVGRCPKKAAMYFIAFSAAKRACQVVAGQSFPVEPVLGTRSSDILLRC